MSTLDPNFVATITANNQRITAWESVMVRREFGNGVSTFQFTPAEGYYGQRYSGLQLQPGDPVTIALGTQKAFTGWCTVRTGGYDASSHQLVIAGQSKTIDLVRSSVVVKPGNYNGSTFQQAAQAVLQPHGIGLTMMNAPQSALQPFKTLSVQYGEMVAEFVSRIAMSRGLFLTDDADGNLVAGLGSPNATVAADLVEGQNIKRATFKLEDPAACSWNKLSGVSSTTGDDNNYPPRAFSATSTNADVRSNITRLFIAEHPEDAQGLATRVAHEAMRSLWPIMQVSITVVGWYRPDGKLWAPAPDGSGMVTVFSPMIFPNQTAPITMSIQAVNYGQDSRNGTTTTLDLKRPDGLTQGLTSGLSDTSGAGSAGSSISTTATPDQPDYKLST